VDGVTALAGYGESERVIVRQGGMGWGGMFEDRAGQCQTGWRHSWGGGAGSGGQTLAEGRGHGTEKLREKRRERRSYKRNRTAVWLLWRLLPPSTPTQPGIRRRCQDTHVCLSWPSPPSTLSSFPYGEPTHRCPSHPLVLSLARTPRARERTRPSRSPLVLFNSFSQSARSTPVPTLILFPPSWASQVPTESLIR
jgi:hypothetical protein